MKSLYKAELLNYFNSALLHLLPQRTTSVTFVISYQQAKINQQILPFKSCGWIREYQFLSVHRALYQVPSVTSCSVNTGLPDFDHHTRYTTRREEDLVSAFEV